jgi:hypothetical protein
MSLFRPADLITADQRHVADMIATAFALTPHEGLRAYEALRHVLARRLTSSERQGLAWAALGSCSPEEAEGIAANVFETDQPSGSPLVPLYPDDATAEAQLWAESASHAERLAYGMAILQRLSADDRERVLHAVEPLPG